MCPGNRVKLISLSGPSKSGKTAVVKKVVGQDDLIEVSGASVGTTDDIWDVVLDWMNAPDSETETLSSTTTDQTTRTLGGQAGIPGTGANAALAFQGATMDMSARSAVRSRGGFEQVIRTVGDSSFSIFIDDYHYMDPALQTAVAKQIKVAAGNRVRIIVASVPHRAQDVVRTNAELIGRTANIDLHFWSMQDLAQIAIIGFPQLNVNITGTIAEAMAIEACSSPQLMQELCLQSCFVGDYREPSSPPRSMEWTSDFRSNVLEQAAECANRSDVIAAMYRGAKPRGRSRNTYTFVDATIGDVYAAVLLAIKEDPPTMQLTYNDLTARVQNVCRSNNNILSSQVVSTCEQLSLIAKRIRPNERIIEWDSNSSTLSIVDPYFLFYLRSSSKLTELLSQ